MPHEGRSISKEYGKKNCRLGECEKHATVEVKSEILSKAWWPYCEEHGKEKAEKWDRKIRNLEL